jgi:putative tricarboxylic transport membrane protein
MLFNEYVAFAVGADSPLKTGRDMIERLKADPSSLNFAIGTARGGTNHSAVALVAKAAGVDVRKLKTVVFQSNSQAATAAMGGHVDVAPISGSAAVVAAKSGKLRIIGVTSPRRLSGDLADVPTWKEQGADVDFSNSRYMLGPRGMTPAQIAYWDRAFASLAQSGPWKKDLEDNNWSSNMLSSAQTERYLARLYDELKVVLTEAGLVK